MPKQTKKGMYLTNLTSLCSCKGLKCVYLSADKNFPTVFKEIIGTLPVANSWVFESANTLPQPILLEFGNYIMKKISL